MSVSLRFDPKLQVVEVQEPAGPIDFVELYRAIREWEASETGIVFPEILEGSGNIELPDGTRTPRVMVFVNGWRLGATVNVSIVGGLIAGRDADRNPIHPVVESARDKVRLMTDDASDERGSHDEIFVPTEAQVRDALYRAARFSEDWEIDERSRMIKRKINASSRKHSILGLYWFCKEQWLKQKGLPGLGFPIEGDNQVPTRGVVRKWNMRDDWRIAEEDLEYLEDGPLSSNDQVLVSAASDNADGDTSAESIRDRVTIGVVTALPKEYAAVLTMLDEPVDYEGLRRRGRHFKIGTFPALNNDKHFAAVVRCGVGNNRAASRAAILADEFPNLTAVIMIGIAGAVPHPSRPSEHVRLGDVVVSGDSGIIQYDLGTQTTDGWISRHKPSPPGPLLLDAVYRLQAAAYSEDLDWEELLQRSKGLRNSARPSPSKDILRKSPSTIRIIRRFFPKHLSIVNHPADPQRRDGTPRVFVGPIGAANRLQKDAITRDELRDRFGIMAIEMEGAGIMDATYDLNLPYLVIRGTCDYCDEFKTKIWQEYAACIAAAYLVALLRQVFAC